MLMLMFVADRRGIFDVQGQAETAEKPVEEADVPDGQLESEKNFCQKDESLAVGMMQISLPFPASEADVAAEISVADGNIMKVTIAKKDQNSLMAYLYKEPIRENFPESEVQLQIAETEDSLMIYYMAEQLYDSEIVITQNAEEETSLVQIAMEPVREKYDRVVVLDAGHGGEDTGFTQDGLMEKDLTLRVVQKTGELLSQAGVQVYYTRTGDETITQENRAALANQLRADMLISIHAAQEEDSSRYGIRTKYNDTFFIPDFSSADLSYILLEKVASSTNEKALGIEADTTEAVIRQAEVPVTLLEIGYLSNAQERKLLEKEDYIDRIAQGIFDALMQSYEEMKS